MARKAAYRKKRQNRFGMFLVSIVVVMLLVVVAFNSIELTAKKEAYQQIIFVQEHIFIHIGEKEVKLNVELQV